MYLHNWTRILAVLGVSAVILGCSAKYSKDIVVYMSDRVATARVQEVNFYPNSKLGAPLSRNQIEDGPGNCLIISTTLRGESDSTQFGSFLSYDELMLFHIFLQIPYTLKPGRHQLLDSSFVQLVGFYQIPAQDKIFYPDSGFVSIDSIDGSQLYGTIDGHFKNIKNEPLSFEGSFRVKSK